MSIKKIFGICTLFHFALKCIGTLSGTQEKICKKNYYFYELKIKTCTKVVYDSINNTITGAGFDLAVLHIHY